MRAFSALLSALWRYAKGRRHIVVLYALMFVAANCISLLEPLIIGQLINVIQQAATVPQAPNLIMLYLLLLLGESGGFWLLHGPARIIEQSIAFHVQAAFIERYFETVVHLPAQWHKGQHSGATINRLRKASNALRSFTSNGYQFIEMIMRIVGSILALILLMPGAAALAVLVAVIALSIVFVFDRYLLPRYEKVNEYEHYTAAALHDYITNVITVITLRLQWLTQQEVTRRLRHYFSYYRHTTAVEEAKWFTATMIITSMTVVVLGWYIFGTLAAGAVPLIGTIFMLYQYLQKIGGAFYTFAWKYGDTVQQYADLKSADMIFTAQTAQRDDSIRLPDQWQRIEIRNLFFTYEDEERREHHLDNISMTLTKGKKIALVGESGSGKSTLMVLLRGLQAADKVDVSVDGAHLPHGLAHLSPHVTLIPQEPEIFANTIEYNITVDTEQSKAEVLRDIELARFASVLERLPKGIQTDISEKGVNLSGGEKQRLALARGIFAAATSDIILLDEPTSSVDSTNEFKIYQNLFRHFSDRCIVSSIHKLHLLPLFDEVYVLDDGKLVESGAVDVLLKSDGVLAGLVENYERKTSEAKK